jgi:hypothetical protein
MPRMARFAFLFPSLGGNNWGTSRLSPGSHGSDPGVDGGGSLLPLAAVGGGPGASNGGNGGTVGADGSGTATGTFNSGVAFALMMDANGNGTYDGETNCNYGGDGCEVWNQSALGGQGQWQLPSEASQQQQNYGTLFGTLFAANNGSFWNGAGTFASDTLGVLAAVFHSTRLGYASSALSLAADHTPTNVMLNAGSTLIPHIVEGSDFPIAVGFAGYDGSQFVANQVIIPVFTPDALQSNTVNENGILMPNPQAIFDSGQFVP